MKITKISIAFFLITLLASCNNVKNRAYMDGWINGYLRAHQQFGKSYDTEQAKRYWKIDSSEYFK